MELKEPKPDPRSRSKSQPNVLSKRICSPLVSSDTSTLTRASVQITTKKTTPPLPAILLEGEVLDIDQDVPEIHRAVSKGNLERLKELVESGESVNTPDVDGWPPLHTAIKTKNYECAQFLIKHGADDFFERQQEEYFTRLKVSARKNKGRLLSF